MYDFTTIRHQAFSLVLLVAGLIIFTGCESSTSPAAAGDDRIDVDTPSGKYIELGAIPTEIIDEAGNAEGVIQEIRPTFAKVESFLGNWQQASSLNEKTQLASDVLAEHTEEGDFFLRSVAAERGLIAVLNSGKAGRHLSSVGMYTETLVENDSHNAELIHDALNELRGTWSTSKISGAAQSTIDRSLLWLERTQGFADDKQAAAATNEKVATSVSGHNRATANVKEGIQRLSSLSNL